MIFFHEKRIKKLVICVMLIFCTSLAKLPETLLLACTLVPQPSFMDTLIQSYPVALACYCENEWESCSLLRSCYQGRHATLLLHKRCVTTLITATKETRKVGALLSLEAL